MRILTLMENTSGNPQYVCEHGLSVYIETRNHRVLADTGASSGFLENACSLGVDLEKVDTVVLSHGHYDHSGGILAFSKKNPRARIYMQEAAGEDYYHGDRYIGIDQRILELPQVIFLNGDAQIDEELFLFSNVTGRRCYPQSNLSLSRLEDGKQVQDDFAHEQYLVIREQEKQILVSGCAHNGILNILDRYRELFQDVPDAVVSGFHMMKKTEYTPQERRVILDTAEELKRMETVFYTGHCTGEPALKLMESVMGDRLHRIYSGCEILL
ncbi:MAG: MBL fold metallo-hydrolase [Lachnospiraceae bacterium]|nr:MBL fold metallo-hydrolase [Lachnospiraceae bacterium]